MEQPILVRFRWTAEELLCAYEYDFRQTLRPVFRLGLHFILALGFLVGIFLIYIGSAVALGIGLIGAGVYWFAFSRLGRRWMISREFRKRPDRDIEIEWQIGPEVIRTKSVLGNSEFGWESLAKVVLTPKGVMFYPMEKLFHWLPRSGFESDTEFVRCGELVRMKVANHYETD